MPNVVVLQVKLAKDIVERNARGAPIHEVPATLLPPGARVLSRAEAAAAADADSGPAESPAADAEPTTQIDSRAEPATAVAGSNLAS